MGVVPGEESTLVCCNSASGSVLRGSAQSLRAMDDKAGVGPHGQLSGRRADTRRERRLPANTPVTITVLGILGEPKAVGTVLDMSGSGLRLRLPMPIPCGAPVKLETDDMLMLGEVVRCEPQGQSYSVGLSLSHSLAALSDLERLNRALLGPDAEVDMAVRESIRTKH
jgi:hypothetical protein